jgi:glycerol 3-phosphatase-1
MFLDVISMEGQIPKLYGDSAVALPGARDLLQNATETGTLWTIVTSGTRPLVTGCVENLPHSPSIWPDNLAL